MQARVNILVVDIDQKSAEFLKKSLSKLHAKVSLATTAEDALKLVKKYDFALILLESFLPDESGFNLALKLRQDENLQHIPIVFLTEAADREKHKIEGYVAGAVDYLVKPVNEYVLLSKARVFIRLEEQRQALLRSNQDLKEFAHVASHDLKSPLNTIQGFSELIVKDRESQLSESAQDYLRRIRRASHNMGELIQDLLAYAAVGTRRQKYEEIELKDLLALTVEENEFQLEKKSGEISLNVEGSLRGDFNQLKQMFDNLVGNAIKYSHKDRPPSINISGGPSDGGYSLKIADNGMGFDYGDTDPFQAFKRFHSHVEGSGLGLAIVKKIVDAHYGTIQVKSVVEQGTTFEMFFPAIEE